MRNMHKSALSTSTMYEGQTLNADVGGGESEGDHLPFPDLQAFLWVRVITWCMHGFRAYL